MAAPQADADLTVATLAQRVQAVYPGVEQIRRSPSGRITAYWFDQGVPGAAVIEPATGQGVASADPNQVARWLTNLHRSLFLGDGGRIAMAVGAAAMLILSLSGVALVARRAGSWRRWFSPLHGPLAGRLHVEIARIAVFGLVLSSATALWMTASTFDLLPDGDIKPVLPVETSGKTGVALDRIAVLGSLPVAELRELSFPSAEDATDVFKLKTDLGSGYLDQGTGALLSWADQTALERVSETIYMLHTGQGAATLGLVLGLMALGVPTMGATRPAPHPWQPASGTGRDDSARRQRGRQHLGLRRDTPFRTDASRAERARRSHVSLRARPLWPCRADHCAGRYLWRRRGACFG
jgi:sulfite reductase (NADPH) flavoprotein alpha-component